MDETRVIVKLTEVIDRVFNASSCDPAIFADIPVSQTPEVNILAEKIFDLSKQYNDARSFILELSLGRLDINPPKSNNFANPFKQLHSDLCHLAWQITQIADGDYDQKVSFFGDFSDAMNKMISALHERKELAEKVVENEKRLAEYSEELKRSNAIKDTLVSIISHDLRNHFNVFVSLSEALITDQEAGNNDMSLEYARMMNDSATQGCQLLINLLDWSRQQKGLVYKPQLFSIKDIINRTISVVAASTAMKNITIEFILDGEQTINSDEAMFGTIVRNLLSNAVKYTPHGGYVKIEVVNVSGFYNISVKDSGIGIPSDKLGQFFKGNFMVSTPGTNSESGTGFGLMLCSDFVHILGGEIWVESVEGNGSTFTFSVPEKV